MEKLFIRLIIFSIGICFSYGQDSLCVFMTKGNSLSEIKAKQRTVMKGDFISMNHLLQILPNSEVTTIDNSGNVYHINVSGKYNYSDIINFKVKEQKSSFTSKYLKHIWEELQNADGDKTLIAGVFRGDVLMSYPPDKATIGSSRISFVWNIDENASTYYLFILNPITDEMVKIEINGSQIALFDENPIFEEGGTYKWAISTDAFPNLDNIPFYSFSLIDRNQYAELSSKYSDFVSDLKDLGMNETEIEEALCKTYGLCK